MCWCVGSVVDVIVGDVTCNAGDGGVGGTSDNVVTCDGGVGVRVRA